jgi:hypothetical protein
MQSFIILRGGVFALKYPDSSFKISTDKNISTFIEYFGDI